MAPLHADTGFTKFPNDLRNVPWRNKPKTVSLYFWLRMNANHFLAGWNGIILSPGELITGRKRMAEETGLTQDEVRTALSHLKRTNHITIRTTNKFSVISFTDKENWEYEDANIPSNIPSNIPNKSPTSPQQVPTERDLDTKRIGEGVYRRASTAIIGIDGTDLGGNLANYGRADDLIRRYNLPDGDTTREALLEDAEKVGFDRLEGALKQAALSNSKQRISVQFYRAVLNNSESQKGAKKIVIETR